MPAIREEATEKMRRDHDLLLQLIERILAHCDQRDKISSCHDCHSSQRGVCHGNIEQLIRTFVEITLKHNLVESMYMEDFVPSEHRIAHNEAHMAIAQQLREIRVVFTGDGNGIKAIEGIERVRDSLLTHFTEHDQQLQIYLDAALASG